jgi:hypothetical protein
LERLKLDFARENPKAERTIFSRLPLFEWLEQELGFFWGNKGATTGPGWGIMSTLPRQNAANDDAESNVWVTAPDTVLSLLLNRGMSVTGLKTATGMYSSKLDDIVDRPVLLGDYEAAMIGSVLIADISDFAQHSYLSEAA